MYNTHLRTAGNARAVDLADRDTISSMINRFHPVRVLNNSSDNYPLWENLATQAHPPIGHLQGNKKKILHIGYLNYL